MRFKATFQSILFVIALAAIGAGCNGPGSNFGGGFFPLPTIVPNVDVAVGDLDGTTSVTLYFDILSDEDSDGNLDPVVDLVLDNTGSGINGPRGLTFSGDDFFVGNFSSSEVRIFRDYRSLSDGASPDVQLTGLGAMSKPKQVVVASDTLFVLDDNNSEVYIFFDQSTITTDVAPDVTLDNGGSGLTNPDGIGVAGGDLFVANYDNPDVMIFRSFTTLSDGDTPDVVLPDATSFLGTGANPRSAYVANDILYVPTSIGPVFVFEGADTLVDDALPDAVLGAASDTGAETLDLLVLDTNLFVAVREPSTGTDPAIIGFTPAIGLTDDQTTSFALRDPAGTEIVSAHELAAAGGTLFAVVYDTTSTYNSGVNQVFIYRYADTLTTGNVDAALELGASDLVDPFSIAANELPTGL